MGGLFRFVFVSCGCLCVENVEKEHRSLSISIYLSYCNSSLIIENIEERKRKRKLGIILRD